MSFVVVIPSARAENLIPCVRALREREHGAEIIVIDDGARETAESQIHDVRWIPGIKPFVFARNVNLGIAAAQDKTVILLNDDALLLTPYGFSHMEECARAEQIGILSAAVVGVVGNPNQHPRPRVGSRKETRTLAFICVAIPSTTIQRLGLLDERFTGYGCEDTDYCERAKKAGLTMGVYDSCVVEHSTVLRPTFRGGDKVAFQKMDAKAKRIFSEKWGWRP